MPKRTAALLRTSTDYGQLSGAQIVIEAVFEDVEVKRAAMGRLEEVCPPETIIASNTSTLDLDELAEGMRHPERLLGMHFFHPAQRMPLVEVVRRRATPPDGGCRGGRAWPRRSARRPSWCATARDSW